MVGQVTVTANGPGVSVPILGADVKGITAELARLKAERLKPVTLPRLMAVGHQMRVTVLKCPRVKLTLGAQLPGCAPWTTIAE
jgi:hypothetical protein